MGTRKSHWRSLTVIGFSLLLCVGLASSAVAIPSSAVGYVNDWAYLLYDFEYPDLEDWLEADLYWIEENTTVEIFVVTTDDLEGYDLERYANVLFNQWGIGKADVDNGLLILVYYDYDLFEYSVRIEVGQGLEGAITDSEASHIVQENMVPWFELDFWYEGFEEGVWAFYDEFWDDPSIRSQQPDPVGWQIFAFENPLIAGMFISVGFVMLWNWLIFASRKREQAIIPLAGIGGLLIFTWWLDPTLVTLGYAIMISLGFTVFLRGGFRMRGGGGSSEGGGYSY